MFPYCLRQREKKRGKPLNIKKHSIEKLVFYLVKTFSKKKKTKQLSLSSCKLNLLTTKENCEEKTSGNQSFQRKSFLLLETIPVGGTHFVYLELFILVKVALFSGSRA